METTHIDDLTLSLYAAGYSGLRDDLFEYVEQHLRECVYCSERLHAEKNREVSEVTLSAAAQRYAFSGSLTSSELSLGAHSDLDGAVADNKADDKPRGLTTQILDAIEEDESARARLWAVVYEELLMLAKARLARRSRGRVVDAAELVNEVYVRLFSDGQCDFINRRHFFAAASRAMERILVDGARMRQRSQRGQETQQHVLDELASPIEADPDEMISLHEALAKLELADARKAHIVRLRYFAGLSADEAANQLGISPRSADNEWRFARAWLRKELEDKPNPGPAIEHKPPQINTRVERLFEHARAMAPADRRPFLLVACGKDKQLFEDAVALIKKLGD